MNNASSAPLPRRPLAVLSAIGTTQLYRRNPYIVAFWSAMFPGFGHFLLTKYIRAYVLFIWEIIINLMSHVNLAFLYTFLGAFDTAKRVIDIRWSRLYIPTYVFAVWDSYRAAVDLNKQYVLWGIIGGGIGFGIGILTKLQILKKKKTTGIENNTVIFVACSEGMTERVRQLLRSSGALGMSLIKGTW